jgi:hypothetical protein
MHTAYELKRLTYAYAILTTSELVVTLAQG